MTVATHRCAVVPIRIRAHDADLGCDVSRVVGYRAACSCNWRGKVWPSLRDARRDADEHRRG